jgi:hypothetical protein
MPAFLRPWRCAYGPAIATGRIAIISRTFFGTWISAAVSHGLAPGRLSGRSFGTGPPTSNFKLLFDRLVYMNGGNPRPDLIDKKSTVLAQVLERSPQWGELSKNHLEGRSAAFFCFGDRGAADLDADGRPKILTHKEWFDTKDEPYDNERDAYQSLVWQCRYSGVEVPDSLWSYAEIGVGKLYADDQADRLESEPAALAAFDAWTRRFEQHVESKGVVEDADDAARSAKSTTQ